MQYSSRKIFISSVLCGIGTGILCSLFWLAISGVNWFGFLVIDLVFLINACLSGIIAADASTEAWYLLFLIGWLIGAAIPAAITGALTKI